MLVLRRNHWGSRGGAGWFRGRDKTVVGKELVRPCVQAGPALLIKVSQKNQHPTATLDPHHLSPSPKRKEISYRLKTRAYIRNGMDFVVL